MKEWLNKYNSFNSLKALVHVKYWGQIPIGNIPNPIFVSIDSNSSCNLKCPHCNAADIMNKFNVKLDRPLIDKIIKLLNLWGTETVCVGGGGESLVNDDTNYLFDQLHKNLIDFGVVTNGLSIPNFLDTLEYAKWVGISVDAGTSETYSKVKGVPEKIFSKVLNNIETLRNRCPNLEISYKYLILPNNYSDIYLGGKIAKDLKCSLIHLRPGADPWFMSDTNIKFSKDQINEAQLQIDKVRSNFESEEFAVFGIMHKFENDWKIKKSFKKCYATYTTCVIYPNGDIGLCCDRRGDASLTLCNINDAFEYWGSQKHIDLVNKININICPRCTYSHINEIFENVIIDDKMLYNFY